MLIPLIVALQLHAATPAWPPSRQDASLVSRFLGCYSLDLGDGRPYRLRLTDTPMGRNWVAVNVAPGNGNRPGNEWQWTPLDSTRFALDWGGIDAAMELTVERRASGYTATGERQWSSGPTPGSAKLHPTVRRIDCPSTK